MNKIILENLKTKCLGKEIFYYTEIDSTQKEIFRRIEKNNIENGTIIITDKQTDGIGTHGRKWFTKENNIAFSFVLFPMCSIEKLENITVEIAELIKDIFKNLYNVELQIKHPNDLMILDKKIGGILTETKLQGKLVKQLVIGIGINTNQEEFDAEIENIATSIKKKFNIEVNNKKLITEFCNKFEEKILKTYK